MQDTREAAFTRVEYSVLTMFIFTDSVCVGVIGFINRPPWLELGGAGGKGAG